MVPQSKQWNQLCPTCVRFMSKSWSEAHDTHLGACWGWGAERHWILRRVGRPSHLLHTRSHTHTHSHTHAHAHSHTHAHTATRTQPHTHTQPPLCFRAQCNITSKLFILVEPWAQPGNMAHFSYTDTEVSAMLGRSFLRKAGALNLGSMWS